MIEVKTPRSSLAALALLTLISPPSVAAAAEVAAAPDRGWHHQELAGDVYYQVFVRSFADADGDGAGDLAGLTSRLDYLNDGDPATAGDLGVDGLWLMPVFQSPSCSPTATGSSTTAGRRPTPTCASSPPACA